MKRNPAADGFKLEEAHDFIMDANECATVIPAARESFDGNVVETLRKMETAISELAGNVKTKFGQEGEW